MRFPSAIIYIISYFKLTHLARKWKFFKTLRLSPKNGVFMRYNECNFCRFFRYDYYFVTKKKENSCGSPCSRIKIITYTTEVKKQSVLYNVGGWPSIFPSHVKRRFHLFFRSFLCPSFSKMVRLVHLSDGQNSPNQD